MVFGWKDDAVGAKVIKERFREGDEAGFRGYGAVYGVPVVVGAVEDVVAVDWGKGKTGKRLLGGRSWDLEMSFDGSHTEQPELMWVTEET